MADLYVCPSCGETEDCACSELATAKRQLVLAERNVRDKLGWLIIRIVERMPDVCSACAAGPKQRCPLCVAVTEAKKKIGEVLE
jgi:hypothetical protein